MADKTKDMAKRMRALALAVAQQIWDSSDQSGIGMLWGEPRKLDDDGVFALPSVNYGIGKGRVNLKSYSKMGQNYFVLFVRGYPKAKPIVELEFESLEIFERDIVEVNRYITDAMGFTGDSERRVA